MIYGRVRGPFPRVTLDLLGGDGAVSVEFIVDTGFDGELALPTTILRRVSAELAGHSLRSMADGTSRRYPVYEVEMEWNGELQTFGAICLEHNPLIGTEPLNGWRIEIDLTDGGSVLLEPPG